MPGREIAEEIEAAFSEVAQETGEGTLTGTLIRRNAPDESVYPVIIPAPSQYTFIYIYDEFTPDEIAAGLVARTDLLINIAAHSLPVTPREDDEIVIKEGTFSVYRVMPIQPGGTPFWYDVQIRKS